MSPSFGFESLDGSGDLDSVVTLVAPVLALAPPWTRVEPLIWDQATQRLYKWNGAAFVPFSLPGDPPTAHAHVKADISDLEPISATAAIGAIPLGSVGAGRLEMGWMAQELYALYGDYSDGWENATLADMPADTVKMRVTAGAGEPEDGTLAQLAYALRGQYAGTAFPTTELYAGRRFCRTDHGHTDYVYDGSSGWLSVGTYGFVFGIDVDTAAAPLRFGELAGNLLFATLVGHKLNFSCKVVGMAVNMAAAGTCTLQVFDGASAITGATLSPAGTRSVASFSLMSNTVSAPILTVAVVSGTIEGPARGMFWVRRFET